MIGNLKSQEEVYLRLHAHLVECDPLKTSSSGNRCLRKDVDVLKRRVRSEGLAFLTKSLPKLGKALDRGLVTGRFNMPDGFKRAHQRASTPAFMQAYFNLVFDEDGLLLDLASVEAVKHLRQVLFFAYKLELTYSAAENSRVIEGFIQTDAELSLGAQPLADEITHLAMLVTQKVFRGFDHLDILPRHGPGSVATGEKGEQKWRFSRLYNSIHQVYPYYRFYIGGGARELTDRLDWYRSLRRLESGIAKVVLVPKDSRGPRLISCEPLEYQWIQQGLGRKLAGFLESGNPHTRGRVNFTHQGINQQLAQTSSASQQYATLDLRDASDRVSLEVVRRVFKRSPQLLQALEACRSTATTLPDGRIVELRKYAPMGSALCFPVEAYIFWVLIVAAVVHGKKLPLDVVEKQVYVYGDDIVVPTDWALLSIQGLEAVGLKVNIDKSCFTGYFRESCGVDAFKGVNVTPVRLRTQWPRQKSDGTALYAYASLANSLRARGYGDTGNLVWEELECVFGFIPFGTSRSSFPCKVVHSALHAETLNRASVQQRWNKKFQRTEFRVLSLSLRYRDASLDGWPRLLKNFVSPPFGDPSRIVLPLSMKVKRGWATVF